MTRFIYSGAEVGSNRTLLEGQGVTLMGLNFWGLRKRGLPKHKLWLVSEHFTEDTLVVVESGATQADKANLSRQELEAYSTEYTEFIANNIERISGFVEFDSQVLGKDWVAQERIIYENDPKLWVVWHESYGLPYLKELAENYDNVAIPYEAVESVKNLATLTQSYSRQFDVSFHGLGVAKPDNLRQNHFTTVSTLSWTSPMRRGETIVWDGTKLVRYPKKMKDQARPRYKSVLDKAGFDSKLFIEDTGTEATKVAVWSYQRLEESMDKKRPDLKLIKGEGQEVSDNSDEFLTGLQGFLDSASDNSAVEVRKNSATELVQRDPQEVTPLPVFGYEMKTVVETDGMGNDVLKDVPVVQSNRGSLRQCNTCFVASQCPAFKENNTCAFNLPVEVKTKEQLKSLLTAIIEMQGQRVAFMRFSEEMNGGYADPNVSQEIDRLFKLVEKLKGLEENRDYIRITAERQSSGGVLSAIFGDRVQALQELPNGGFGENEITEIIQDSIED